VLSCYGLAILPVRPWALALVVVAMFGFAVDVQTGVPRVWSAIAFVSLTVGSIAFYDGFGLSWITLLVGIVGIINTMLMSTTERFIEFGVLRTNGWSQSNILSLVTLESACLGLLAGVVGCGMALAGTSLANQFISGGLRLGITPYSLALGVGLSIVMGTLGGLYPAWRAARMVPMEAIRLGSH
jgi:ABC-type antimicrobial peptide transport system permease subunit